MKSKHSFIRKSVVGYKLFRKNKKRELTSVIISKGPFKVVYKTEGKNYAPKRLAQEGNYLTFFNRLSECILWRRAMKKPNTQIWKIQANYIKKNLPKKFDVKDLIFGTLNREDMPTYWPQGTDMARNIVLLERVNFRK